MKRLSVLFIVLFVPCAQAATVETFTSPDSSFGAIAGFINNANRSLLLSSYTFTSPELTRLLAEKAQEGVEIGLIVEKSPAGGMSDYEISALCALQAGNISVVLYDGPLKYMHAKYAVRDGRDVLVTSENYGYPGFTPGGTYGNRGWGVIVYGELARELEGIYRSDVRDSVVFQCPPGKYTIKSWGMKGAHAPVFGSRIFEGQNVSLINSPDSLEDLLGLISSAKSSIDAEMFYIYTHWGSASKDTAESAPSPVLEALLQKAREGVRVRVLLDSTYYEMDPGKSTSNYNTINYISSIAAEEGIPIEARAVDLDGLGLSMLHNKGIIIDGKKALVSSINWNENSIMNNREVAVLLEGESASYYSAVFGHDWNPEPPEDSGFWPAAASLSVLTALVLYFTIRKFKEHRVVL